MIANVWFRYRFRFKTQPKTEISIDICLDKPEIFRNFCSNLGFGPSVVLTKLKLQKKTEQFGFDIGFCVKFGFGLNFRSIARLDKPVKTSEKDKADKRNNFG